MSAGPRITPTRREALLALAAGLSPLAGHTQPKPQRQQSPRGPATRAIPATGELVPAIGLGTWITFNVGNDPAARGNCADVMRAFFDAGGRMVDSSPMYGSSQSVVGEGLARINRTAGVFAADKVWIGSGARGPAQIEESRKLWRVPRFDLLQVHNLLAWEQHLPALLAMRSAKQLRYVGITTSEGRRHSEIESIMASQPIDFVQITYNPLDRDVESRILPLAREKRIAVIANRPFREGALLRALKSHALPPWAKTELGCDGWAQFVLKFIVSHPAVTCAIPATRSVAHVQQNMGAAVGPMPDAAMRDRMAAHLQAL